MTTSNSERGSAIFSGPPRKMVLQGSDFPLDGPFELELDDKLSAGGGVSKVRVKRDKSGKLQYIKVKLDKSTPPGKYNSRLIAPSGDIPIELEVYESIALSMSPPQLTVEGRSGSKVVITALFTNKGNVTLEIPRNHHLGIYDDDGIETAFASTYRMDENDPMLLFGNFIHKLRDGYGGILKMRVTKGYGALPAGASRSVMIEVALQKKLVAGHDYHGIWSLFNSNFAVSISVKA